MKKFISWRRVSTKKQGATGLGLSAQKDIISYFVDSEKGELVADYEEVYTGKDLKGCKELQKAIHHAKEIGATLIIAKTDRFRNTIEALQVFEEMNGNIFFCDLPHTDKFTLTLFFSLAEREALLVSIRTKAALNVIKEKIEKGEEHYSKSGRECKKLGRPTGLGASEKAIKASVDSRKTTAKENPNNKAFLRFMSVWERRNGKIDRHTNMQPFVDELNALSFRTATGMPFDISRARAMLYKVRKLYAS